MSDPLDLDRLEAVGAVRFGANVVRAILILEDGRIQKLMPPLPPPPPATAENLSGRKARIVAILKASPVPLTRKALARKLGVKVDPKKGVAGGLLTDITALLEAGIIFEHLGHLADDRLKFQVPEHPSRDLEG